MTNPNTLAAQNAREIVDLMAIHAVTQELSDFVGACIDEMGKPKAPDKALLMKARSFLPARYLHSFQHKK